MVFLLNNDIIRGFRVCKPQGKLCTCCHHPASAGHARLTSQQLHSSQHCSLCGRQGQAVMGLTARLATLQIRNLHVWQAFMRVIPIEILLLAIFIPLACVAIWISNTYILTPEVLEQNRRLEAEEAAQMASEGWQMDQTL